MLEKLASHKRRSFLAIGLPAMLGFLLNRSAPYLTFNELLLFFMFPLIFEIIFLVPIIGSLETEFKNSFIALGVIAVLSEEFSLILIGLAGKFQLNTLLPMSGWLILFVFNAGLIASREFGETGWNWFLKPVLGERAIAGWMLLLWVTLFFAIALESTAAYYGTLWNIALPLATVAAFFHWAPWHPGKPGCLFSCGMLITACVWAFLINRVPYQILTLDELVGPELSKDFRAFLIRAWSFVSIGLISTLTIVSLTRTSKYWRLILTAIIGGALGGLFLAYPVFSQVYNTAISGIAIDPFSQRQVLVVSSVIGYLVVVGAVPLTIILVRPFGPRARFLWGAGSGIIAAFVLLGMLGVPSAGLMASSQLYNQMGHFQEFNQAEWMYEVAVGVDRTTVITSISFLLFLLCGFAMGGIAGLLTPVTGKSKDEAASTAQFWSIIAEISVIPLLFVSLIAIVIFALLQPLLLQIFTAFGKGTTWNTVLQLPLFFILPWFVALFVQFTALHYARKIPMTKHVSGLLLLGGVHGWLGYLLFTLMSPSTSTLLIPLILLLLSSEMIFTGWQSYKQYSQKQGSGERMFRRADWTAAGATAGILVAIVCYYPLSIIANLAEINVPLLDKIYSLKDAPNDPHWFFDAVSTLYPTNGMLFSLLLIGSIFGGALTGFVTSFFPFYELYHLWSMLGNPKTLSNPWLRGLRIWGPYVVVGLAVVMCNYFSLKIPILYSIGLTIVIARRRLVRLFPPFLLLMLFSITLITFLNYSLLIVGKSFLPAELDRYAAAIFVPFGCLTYQALLSYTPSSRVNLVRAITIWGSIFLSILSIFLTENSGTAHERRVIRYFHNQWTSYDLENSMLAKNVVYHFAEDDQGNMWFAGNTGILLKKSMGSDWEPFLPGGFATSPSYQRVSNTVMDIAEDKQGRLWLAWGTQFGLFNPFTESSLVKDFQYPGNSRLDSPPMLMASHQGDFSYSRSSYCDRQQGIALTSQPVTTNQTLEEQADTLYDCLALSSNVVDMIIAQDGDIWIATENDGLIQLLGNQPLVDSRWNIYPIPDIQLSPGTSQLIDEGNGKIILANEHEVVRFDGLLWEQLPVPSSSHINAVFLDSRNMLWVGTDKGALRFEGEDQYKYFQFNGTRITSFAEGPRGILWIGTNDGVIRYELDIEKQTEFTEKNSGLPSKQIADMFVDSSGALWMSIITEYSFKGYPWSIFVNIAFFTSLFIYTYHNYRHFKKR